MPTSQTWSYM
ncbi:hypothetical protein F383_36289 [Gossypium arboreum]|uniref:Uncharacterized protein n=1 Tax=Gossypium arboreum TaxID=29729 RepID=A0A0B0MY92_GOSAR|nr:hypothetical protein F383_37375 [Gossypium arboreum]KHG03896.1 hypothetical protein F383_27335 [Gossypium arboreum]KHG28677.1 hypothetical protein F383_35142 [Gossypium arboreum]KHG29629.1 hypothetical protein F383_36166 [Gossypium arboreum]KHG29643.1 hypothetical protein F383_36229 [Gossypium arboreum]